MAQFYHPWAYLGPPEADAAPAAGFEPASADAAHAAETRTMADAAHAEEEEEVDEPYVIEARPLQPSDKIYLNPEATPFIRGDSSRGE